MMHNADAIEDATLDYAECHKIQCKQEACHGEMIAMVFTMQGVGAVFGSCIFSCLTSQDNGAQIGTYLFMNLTN